MQNKQFSEEIVIRRNIEHNKLRGVPDKGDCFYIAAVLQLLCAPVSSPYDTFKKRFDALLVKLNEFEVDTKNLNADLLQREIERYYDKGVRNTPEDLNNTPQLAHLIRCVRLCLVNHTKKLVARGDVAFIYTLLDDHHYGLDEEEQIAAVIEKLNKHITDRYYADAVMMQAFTDVFDCSIELFTFNSHQHVFENNNRQFEKDRAGSTIQIAHVNGEDPLSDSPIKNHYDRFFSAAPAQQQTAQQVTPPTRPINTVVTPPQVDTTITIETPVVPPQQPLSDLEQLRLYAQNTQKTSPLFSQALFNYINIVDDAARKNKNHTIVLDQLDKTTSSVKTALQGNNPQALLEAANTAHGNVSLPKKIGLAICGALCILAGLVGIGLAAASIVASHGLSTPLALWSASLAVNIIIMGASLFAGSAGACAFFSQAQDKDAAKATKELHEAFVTDAPLGLN
ncbi:OTU domain-containing protein [Legionella fallonii]|uniref:Uncharacterized protein n=1 Tax=Legionella fallonii LLAP-10 TaxID=1212491 RepID=A0A098GAM8_9GAMM|nr:hypothetical protein [Legionella fallonii]CEG59080.1 protein of unknown function [Legionella fallonii LLAP-10]